MLRTLRSRTRKIMLVTLILVIPALGVFFGWSLINPSGGLFSSWDKTSSFARFCPPDGRVLGLKWWRRWSTVERDDLKAAQDEMRNRLGFYFRGDLVNALLGEYGAEQLFSKRELITQAIDTRVLANYAKTHALAVTDNEIRATAQSYFQGRPREQWERALEMQGYTAASFERHLRSSLLLEHASLIFREQAKVSLFELWQEHLKREQKLKIDYVAFKLSDYMNKVAVTEDALRKYYEANAEKFRIGDQRRYRYAFFRKDALTSAVKVTEKDLTEFYNTNSEKYARGPRARVRQILFRVAANPKATPADREAKAREALAKAETAKAALDKGADFAQLANQVSEDPDNISTDGKTRLGGLLPRWISEDDAAEFGEEYVRAALALGPSQISAITVMRGGKYPGLVILEQEETRQKSYPALEDIRQKVEADCAESMLGRKFEEKYAELEQKTKNYSRLEDMSQALAMTVGMSSWTLTTSPVIAPELGVLDRATLDYINEELKPGDRSVLLKSPDLLYILEVVNHRPTYIPKYEEARDKVEAAYRMEKGRELMSAAKDEFLKKSTSADAMRAAAAAGGLQVKTTDLFTREAMPGDMPGPLMDFERDSFTAKPGSIHASLGGLSKDEFSGCVVWHLKEVQDPDRAEFLKNVAVLQHDLSLLGQRALADEWLWDQRKAMEIEINQQLLGREM